jgi:hypothetical protein
MMKDGKCKRCNHPFQDHHHFRVKWVQISDKSDPAMKEKWQNAKDDKEKNKVLRTSSQQALNRCSQRIDDAMRELAQSAEEYSRLSLLGSFSAQVEKAVRLLKLRYKGMEEKVVIKEENGVIKEQLRKVKESLDLMEKNLELLTRANEIPRLVQYCGRCGGQLDASF